VESIFYTAEFSSTFEAMDQVLNETVNALIRHEGVVASEEPKLRLCLEEALVNAIRHGNGSSTDRKVRLSLLDRDGWCLIKIYDEGTGFAPDAVNLPDGRQLGGRGVCLMRHYMERVAFNHAEHCLEMMFRPCAFRGRQPA
jgi:anti-sigma regulatory factor (Ser/Thr protein kinase)